MLNFLKEIRGLVKCPITHEEVLNPFLGTDHTSYEIEAIRYWVELHHVYPSTREPMQMNCLMLDYTMRNILSVLKDNKITEEFIADISKPSIPPPSVNTTSRELVPPCISKYYTKGNCFKRQKKRE